MKKKDNIEESFFEYSYEFIADITLGATLGIIINKIADLVGNYLNLPFYAIIIFQLFLICLILYIMKVDSKYLYKSWKGQTNYGIIFMSVFLAVQRNMVKFFEDIYSKEKDKMSRVL